MTLVGLFLAELPQGVDVTFVNVLESGLCEGHLLALTMAPFIQGAIGRSSRKCDHRVRKLGFRTTRMSGNKEVLMVLWEYLAKNGNDHMMMEWVLEVQFLRLPPSSHKYIETGKGYLPL